MKFRLPWMLMLGLGGIISAGASIVYLKNRNKQPATQAEQRLLQGTVLELAAGKPVPKTRVQNAFDIAKKSFPATASRLKTALKQLA